MEKKIVDFIHRKFQIPVTDGKDKRCTPEVEGPNSRCLGILGAGQIDPFGNVNFTLIRGKAFLVGSGGANDVGATAKETVVVMNAGKARLIPKVPYVTFPGNNVKTLVADVGVFEKVDDHAEFILKAYFPSDSSISEAQCVAAIQEQVGWHLKIGPTLQRIDPPTWEELTLLRLFDPRGFFIGA
jgi:acyl CoA:acetate/3-ketoacid CoA transferase beta subunit